MSLVRAGSLLLLVIVAISCSSPAPSGPSPVLNVPDTATASASAGSDATYGTSAATPLSATMQFGLVDVGSGFPPISGHDRSAHANDTIVPGTVVIDAGGTVTFNVVNPHQVSIYEPGKRPQDVDTTDVTAAPAGCPPVPLINDQDGLVQAYKHACNVARPPIVHQFNTPGRYLVICSFTPHFQIGMYGWVIVRDRTGK